ncbi:MAG: response regulator [Alphaproteobacteria bacterium]|nr:response regulator [Alphaproteobacteria bacterium]
MGDNGVKGPFGDKVEGNTKQSESVKILVVDDAQSAINAAQMHLMGMPSVEIITATNGEEGLKFYEEHEPDIIITDCDMPKKGDGYKMVRAIRRIEGENKDTIIYMQSGRDGFQNEAYEAGVNPKCAFLKAGDDTDRMYKSVRIMAENIAAVKAGRLDISTISYIDGIEP